MQASRLAAFRALVVLWVLFSAAWVAPAFGQQTNRIAADLVAEHAPIPGETLTVALRFRPQKGWHGYWSNPGDAGQGMSLDWQLPEGWEAGEPLYPVPERLELIGLINHVYKEPYVVLIPIEVPMSAAVANIAPITLRAQWLACSDTLCVPERDELTLRFSASADSGKSAFDQYRAAIPPLITAPAQFAFTQDRLRIAIPLPASVEVGGEVHIFVEQQNLVDYNALQTFMREGDVLVAEIPRGGLRQEAEAVSGLLALGDAGLRFEAVPGAVPEGGLPVRSGAPDIALPLLLGGALLGGLLLNLMPCVFPILSLKALALARAGHSEAVARADGVAYTAGVILACLALGALMLILRASGEQVGWAFQLQQPLVVAALLALAILITANFAGLFELPGLPIRTSGKPLGAFGTGLLAAIVATPCTGPFMAAAMGAALLLVWWQALLLFAALGLGLALPFLLLGFVPALRKALPRPGAWMDTFRKIMAVPMALTALALAWLAWRQGGLHFAFAAAAFAVLLIVALVAQRRGSSMVAGIALIVALYFAASLPFRVEAPDRTAAAASILEPTEFSNAALAEARASGSPVFLWFTADWCITCKVNERVAIEREATKAAFAQAGVIAMRGDWTDGDPEITRFLEAQGAAGVPLYMWYPKGGGAAEQLPQVLTPETLTDLAKER